MSVKPGSTLRKRTDEVLPYIFDWSAWLDTATISSSVWTLTTTDGALVKADESILTGSQKTQAFLSDGTVGYTYCIANTIVTNETPARTGERSFHLLIRAVC